MTPTQARELMHEWVSSPSLRAHMEAVAACMAAYADRFHPGDSHQRDRWLICGLLHDFDYEKHPSQQEHPFIGVQYLRANHGPASSAPVDSETFDAILGHADYSGTPRTTPLAKTLYAVDELAGFIVACSKVRPNGIADLEPSSVRKKLKDKAFAAAVSRDDIRTGIAELGPIAGVDETSHILNCIHALRDARDQWNC
ncbi:MAG TPA: HD domain-containing protein [Phycisphaerales bacterium]|nr:HD domain-containing protein [Phycisphaerales bacterium]